MAEYIRTSIESAIDITALVTIHRLVYDSEKYRDNGERHSFYELVCVESGEFCVDIDGEPHVLHAGELLVYAPDAFHQRGDRPSNALIYIVSFETRTPIAADIFNRALKLSFSQYALLSSFFTDALQIPSTRIRTAAHKGMTLGDGEGRFALQKVKNKLELLLIELCESREPEAAALPVCNAANASDAELAQVSEFLKAHLAANLTLEEIAAGCLMSVSKLKKLFSRRHPGGVIGYFNTLKVNEAKRLIRNTDLNFTQIAESLGFAYPHYFSRRFKAVTGMTPTQYARRIDRR